MTSNEINTPEVVIEDNKAVEILAPSASIYSTPASYAHAKEVAKAFATSALVPKAFLNNLGSCIIAYELSQQLQVSPFMIMQNMYIVMGIPTFKSPFAIALLRTRSRFKDIDWSFSESNKGIESCTISGTDRATGKIMTETLTMEQVKKFGWWDKNDSMWPKMPHQMFKYRTTAFFLRTNQPELLFGMQLADEIDDVKIKEVEESKKVDELNDAVSGLSQNGIIQPADLFGVKQ